MGIEDNKNEGGSAAPTPEALTAAEQQATEAVESTLVTLRRAVEDRYFDRLDEIEDRFEERKKAGYNRFMTGVVLGSAIELANLVSMVATQMPGETGEKLIDVYEKLGDLIGTTADGAMYSTFAAGALIYVASLIDSVASRFIRSGKRRSEKRDAAEEQNDALEELRKNA